MPQEVPASELPMRFGYVRSPQQANGLRHKNRAHEPVFERRNAYLLSGFLGSVNLHQLGVGHINHGTTDFKVFKVATTLRAHGAFAFEGRCQQCQQCVVAFADTSAPSACIAKLRVSQQRLWRGKRSTGP